MILKATHTGVAKVGNIKFDVAVLENTQRVISQNSISALLGISGFLESFLNMENIKPFVPDHVRENIKNPLVYCSLTGEKIRAYDATMLADICNIWINADIAGAIQGSIQKIIATKANDIIRAFATVGLEVLQEEDPRQRDWPKRLNEVYQGERQ